MRKSSSKSSEECWVFKLGGSLLNQRDLAEQLRSVIRQTSRKPLLVVGGGSAADLVRQWEACHPLDSHQAHWLAIRAMGLNECLVESLLLEADRISCRDEAEEVWSQGGVAILNAFAWLSEQEELGKALPESWDVTSDSIAAFAAMSFGASGLMLLKSVDWPASIPAFDEMSEPFVDAYFHRLAPKLPQIAWCNLASSPLQIKTAW